MAWAASPARGPWLVEVSTAEATACWRATDARQTECKTVSGAYTIPGSTISWTAALLPAKAPLAFAVIGDSGKGNDAQWAVARRLTALDPQLILHVGDIVYEHGEDEDYDDRYFKPYAALLARRPLFPAIGNHDYGNYYFLRKKGEKRYQRVYRDLHHQPKYYSFDAGGAHFISLDTNQAFGIAAAEPIGPGTPQDAWLRADLSASKARWKVVLLHVPVYTAFSHGDHEKLRLWLEPLFHAGGVDLVLQGHVHLYERTLPIGGIVYVTVGTGGGSLHKTTGGPDIMPASGPFAKTLKAHGLLSVRLDDDRLSMEFIDADGRSRDTAILEKAKR